MNAALHDLRVIYFRPYGWIPALRLELPAQIASSNTRLSIVLEGVMRQFFSPAVIEPYPLFLADRMVKSLGAGVAVIEQAIAQHVASESADVEMTLLCCRIIEPKAVVEVSKWNWNRNQDVAVVGSPSTNTELTLDLLQEATEDLLVGALTAFQSVQNGSPIVSVGQIVGIELKNRWHEDSVFRNLIKRTGEIPPITNRQDTRTADLVVGSLRQRNKDTTRKFLAWCRLREHECRALTRNSLTGYWRFIVPRLCTWAGRCK